MRETWTGVALFFQLSAITLGAIFGSLLLGIFLDRTLGIAPFGTLCVSMIGVLGGTVAIYRIVSEEYKRIGESKG